MFQVARTCVPQALLSMNRNELFRLQKAEHDAARAMQLAIAKTEALAEGKEPFDLKLMDEMWRDNPDTRHMANGSTLSLEERVAEWSEKYYVQYRAVRTMREFVAKMKLAQVHGFFD